MFKSRTVTVLPEAQVAFKNRSVTVLPEMQVAFKSGTVTVLPETQPNQRASASVVCLQMFLGRKTRPQQQQAESRTVSG